MSHPNNDVQKRIREACGIPDEAFFSHYSDMYVGCKDYAQVQAVLKAALPFKGQTFTPQKGSDMDKYPVAVDIPFAYMNEYAAARRPKVAG